MNSGRSGHHRGNNQHNLHGGDNTAIGNSHSNIGSGGYGMGSNNNYGGNLGGGYTNSSNHNSGGNMNRQDAGIPYNRQNNFHGMNQPHNGNVGNSGWMNRGHLDMPNLQALGINSQGSSSSNQGQNMNNPLGVGLNLNSLPMNPALVAAALNQWSLLGNQLQNQNQDQQASLLYNMIVSNKKLFQLLLREATFYHGWLKTTEGILTLTLTLEAEKDQIIQTIPVLAV